MRPNIVQIKSEQSLGSGFIFATDEKHDVLIVTNYHVVAEGAGFSVTFLRSDGKPVTVSDVQIVKILPEQDLALLKAPRMSVHGQGLTLGESQRAGQSVVTLGFPIVPGTGLEPVLSSGLVTVVKQTVDEREYVQTNMQLTSGNSGGPAIDSCGRVIGIAAGYLTEAKHAGLLVPSQRIRELYEKYRTPRPPAAEEVQARAAQFVQLLQHDETSEAAGFLSRTFLVEQIFPIFKQAAEQGLPKREHLTRVLQLLAQQGVDLGSLTEAQFARLQHELGIEFTPIELLAFTVMEQARRHSWDTYRTLQEFAAPFVDYSFGRIHNFEVEGIEGEGDARSTYLALARPKGMDRYHVTFVYEWGDWRISGFNVVNGEADVAASEKSETASAQRDSVWIPASKRP